MNYSREEFIYDNLNVNKEYKKLSDELIKAKETVKEIDNKIREFRSNCDHDFKMYCSGPYDDTYMCTKCLMTIEH